MIPPGGGSRFVTLSGSNVAQWFDSILRTLRTQASMIHFSVNGRIDSQISRIEEEPLDGWVKFEVSLSGFVGSVTKRLPTMVPSVVRHANSQHLS
jgi:hypothetical protein